MSEQHTPDTRSIRNHWVESAIGAEELAEAHEEFDRWLDLERADARREGQAEAWDEGYRAGADDMSDLRAGRLTFQTITSNPYEEDRHVDQ